jgi:superfamily II DNA or RNA helicase
MTATLKATQIADLAVAIRNPRSLNISEPGTGKTPIFCALSYYYWTKKAKKTIIVQPNHLRSKNRLEVIRFTGFKPEEVVVLEKAHEVLGPHKRRAYSNACQETGYINYIDDPDAKVFCVGFTFLKNHWTDLIDLHPEIDLVIVDEGHLGYKTYNSKASAELYKLMDYCKGFYYCTGTPIDGRLDSCFAATHIIEPSYYGSYQGFLAQHAGFVDDYGKVLYWVNEEKVTEILNRHGVRRLWKDIHGDQDRDIIIIDDLEMKPKMREAYDEFDQMACVELDGLMLDGTNPGVATMRARQIINCPQIFGIEEKTSKQEYLEGIAESGMIVFSSMPDEVEANAQILRDLGLKVGVMHGKIPHKERVAVDEAYQTGELDAICATPAVASTGWNWQRTKIIVYTSLDYLDSNLEQSIRRGERELRQFPLTIYFLEYERSVDQKVRKIVIVKENLSNTVMQNVKGLT